jgi:hypothetical protein
MTGPQPASQYEMAASKIQQALALTYQGHATSSDQVAVVTLQQAALVHATLAVADRLDRLTGRVDEMVGLLEKVRALLSFMAKAS